MPDNWYFNALYQQWNEAQAKRDSGSDRNGQDRADGLGAQASQNGGYKPHRPPPPSIKGA